MSSKTKEALRDQLREHPLCAVCLSHNVVVAATRMICIGDEEQQSVCARHDESDAEAD